VTTCIYLQKLYPRDIIAVYLIHGKGGNDDCYARVTDSRGGSKNPAGIEGYGMAAASTKGVGWLQGFRVMAHPSRRPEEVPRLAEKQHIRTGKLNFVLQIAHVSPIDCLGR